jgi:hypothetical protein
MDIFPVLLILTLLILGVFASTEVWAPHLLKEGFTGTSKTGFFASFSSPRSDIGPTQEDSSFLRDPRFFADYTDVTRSAVDYDFCRMIARRDEPENLFFACGLNGTDGLDSAKFRTPAIKDGFRVSHDDYMRDINGDGRADYCRILKWNDGTYQAVCNRATDIGFEAKEVVDSDPPTSEDPVKNMQTILTFYQGCVLWFRFHADMRDSVKTSVLSIAGNMTIDETPKKSESQGIEFNGIDQFLRVSDASDLTMGQEVPLRSLRTWMVWAYFDEFTNNAKIFDFGNGAGRDNVFLGILGKGDSETQGKDLRPLLCGGEDTTVPTVPSGQQATLEMSPQRLMETTDANINEFKCVDFEIKPRRLSPSTVAAATKRPSGKATLLFEIWDKQARKMRIKVGNAIPLKKWVHLCITTTNDDAFRPNYAVYVDGKRVSLKENGFLPATSGMTNCYIGKSNWYNSVSQFENRDELFKGRLFDFRAYRKSVSDALIEDSYDWGKAILQA